MRGPRVLAASSGLAPGSMAIDWTSVSMICNCSVPHREQTVRVLSSRKGNPPPERTACLWRQLGGKGGIGGGMAPVIPVTLLAVSLNTDR